MNANYVGWGPFQDKGVSHVWTCAFVEERGFYRYTSQCGVTATLIDRERSMTSGWRNFSRRCKRCERAVLRRAL